MNDHVPRVNPLVRDSVQKKARFGPEPAPIRRDVELGNPAVRRVAQRTGPRALPRAGQQGWRSLDATVWPLAPSGASLRSAPATPQGRRAKLRAPSAPTDPASSPVSAKTICVALAESWARPQDPARPSPLGLRFAQPQPPNRDQLAFWVAVVESSTPQLVQLRSGALTALGPRTLGAPNTLQRGQAWSPVTVF